MLSGPRLGKTTLVRQVLADLDLPSAYASADEPGGPRPRWGQGLPLDAVLRTPAAQLL